MASFALIGAAGYIAPRHMKAVSETGGEIVAAMDPSDSVGVLDSFFPEAHFFTEFERFDRHVDRLRRKGEGLDYVSICSPNYLHDSHTRFALRAGADAICEKPLVLNPWNIDALEEMERETGRTVHTILQLRLHPAIVALREQEAARPSDAPKREVDLTYVTSRGRWYMHSWKADTKRSGGIATNIGVHFYDMLSFVFGRLQDNRVHLHEDRRAAGYLEYERARVRWFLSISPDDLPQAAASAGVRTYRSITVDGEEIEFSGGFTDLHTESYRAILQGGGFGLNENRAAIETVAFIRGAPPDPSGDEGLHPFARRR